MVPNASKLRAFLGNGFLALPASLTYRVGLPVYMWRKHTGHEGSVSATGLGVYCTEINAARAGEIDGYAMFIMQITDHPVFN